MSGFYEGQGIILLKDGSAITADERIIVYEDYSFDRIGRIPRSIRNHPLKVGRVTVGQGENCPYDRFVFVDGQKDMAVSEDVFLENTPISSEFTYEATYCLPDFNGSVFFCLDDKKIFSFRNGGIYKTTGEKVAGYKPCEWFSIKIFVNFSYVIINDEIKIPIENFNEINKISVLADNGQIYISKMVCYLGNIQPKELPEGSFARFYNPRTENDFCEILSDIRKKFPVGKYNRLYLTDARLEKIKKRLFNNDYDAVNWLDKSKTEADAFLLEEIPEYEISDGIRLLDVSRLIKRRCILFSTLYRITNDKKYAEKCRDYMLKAASYPDWNDTHFLDTAELCCGISIGYDAIYEFLSEYERHICITAIKEKALNPSLFEYRYGSCNTRNRWSTSVGNWNPVCNAGMIMGAVMVLDTDEKLAHEIIGASLYGMNIILREFEPDGAWHEGVGYWHYTIEFICCYFDVLYTSTGKTYNYLNKSGISKTAAYYLAMLGPGGTFNYGDMKPQYVKSPELYWYAEVLNDEALRNTYRQIEKQYNFEITTHAMVYFNPSDIEEKHTLPLDMVFNKWWVGSLRSSWDRENSLYIAFQGGRPNVGHSQMSIGNFVLDAKGERWALDLGYDDYNINYLDNSYNANAWWIYRKSAEGHNCLIINPDDKHFQVYNSDSPICDFKSEALYAKATLDLSTAYERQAKSYYRTFELFRNENIVTITDSFELREKNSEIYWFMHTDADIKIKNNEAILIKNNKKIRVIINTEGEFSVMEPVPLPTTPVIPVRELEAKNEGVKKLAIHLTNLLGENIISVSIL